MSHELTRGDKVYSEVRLAQGKQPNGYIVRLVQSGGEITDVHVRWHSEPSEDEYLLADVFDGMWESNFPNTWYLMDH